ncbi:MAG: hypothetical protein IJV65_01570, partial [Kiritimatiellae bacterium]|nr:hypothetical protein [Kiritimatiellia bacterium]
MKPQPSPTETARAACLFLLVSFDEPLGLAFVRRAMRHLGPDTASLPPVAADAAVSELSAERLVAPERGGSGAAGATLRFGPYLHNRRRAAAMDAGLRRGWRADAPAVDSLFWELETTAEERQRTWNLSEIA